MKINPYIQVQQVYGTKKPSQTKATKKVGLRDGFEISNIGREIQVAKQAVANAPDVRAELTEPLKKAIDQGKYDVSSESFADKLWAIAEGK